MGEAQHKGCIFLSHTGRDDPGRNLAPLLHEHLTEKENRRAFFDESSIKCGERLDDVIEAAVRQCDVFVAIVTKQYLQAKWPLLELHWARVHKRPIFTVLIDMSVDEVKRWVRSNKAPPAWQKAQLTGAPEGIGRCILRCLRLHAEETVLVVTTEHVRKDVLSLFKRKVHVVPPGREKSRWLTARHGIVNDLLKAHPDAGRLADPHAARVVEPSTAEDNVPARTAGNKGMEQFPDDTYYVEPRALQDLEERVTTREQRILLLHGPPGKGKSAVMRRLVTRSRTSAALAARFPDGVVHLEIGRGRIDPEEQQWFLLGKLQELEGKLAAGGTDREVGGVVRSTPPADLVRQALQNVRGLLADGKQRLVLVDDVWPAQVQLLQDGGLFSGSFKGAAIVASRDSTLAFSVEGQAELVALEVEDDVCEAILASRAYGDPQQHTLKPGDQVAIEYGKQVLDMCGATPLMLRLVASVVNRYLRKPSMAAEAWKLVKTNLSAHLRRVPNLNDYPRPLAAYEMSILELDAGAKRLLGILALFPPARMLPAGAVLAVWVAITGNSDDFMGVLDALEQLAVIELVPQATPPGTYDVRMHALLSEHLKRTDDPPPALEEILPSDSTAQDHCPKVAAASALLLYQDGLTPRDKDALQQQLQRLVPLNSLINWWWEHSRRLGCRTDDVARALQLAHQRGNEADVEAVRNLLLAAATGRAWPALQALTARLLGDVEMAGGALAFAAATRRAFSRDDRWPPAYYAALERLIATCPEKEACLKRLWPSSRRDVLVQLALYDYDQVNADNV